MIIFSSSPNSNASLQLCKINSAHPISVYPPFRLPPLSLFLRTETLPYQRPTMASSSNPPPSLPVILPHKCAERAAPTLHRFYETKEIYDERQEAMHSVRLVASGADITAETLPSILANQFTQYLWEWKVTQLGPFEYQVKVPMTWKEWALKEPSILLGGSRAFVFRLRADYEVTKEMYYTKLSVGPLPPGMQSKDGIVDLVRSFGDVLDVVEPIGEHAVIEVSTCAKQLIPEFKMIKYIPHRGPLGNTKVFFHILATSTVGDEEPSNNQSRFLPVPPGFRERVIPTPVNPYPVPPTPTVGNPYHASPVPTIPTAPSPLLRTVPSNTPNPNSVPNIPETATPLSDSEIHQKRMMDYNMYYSSFPRNNNLFSPLPRSFFFPPGTNPSSSTPTVNVTPRQSNPTIVVSHYNLRSGRRINEASAVDAGQPTGASRQVQQGEGSRPNATTARGKRKSVRSAESQRKKTQVISNYNLRSGPKNNDGAGGARQTG